MESHHALGFSTAAEPGVLVANEMLTITTKKRRKSMFPSTNKIWEFCDFYHGTIA
jgi:hypothetical protein